MPKKNKYTGIWWVNKLDVVLKTENGRFNYLACAITPTFYLTVYPP